MISEFNTPSDRISYSFDVQVLPDTIVLGGQNASNDPGEIPEIFQSMTIQRSDLLMRHDCSDYALWGVHVDLRTNTFEAPSNLLAATSVNKRSLLEEGLSRNRTYAVQIFMPTKSCDFTQCSIGLVTRGSMRSTCNLPLTQKNALPIIERPTLKLAASSSMNTAGQVQIASGGQTPLNIALFDANGIPMSLTCEAYLETTGGQLSRSRVTLVNGVGRLNVMAQGLDVGETFKVKAGFKYFSGLAELAFCVTAAA